jgi:hypothetical protein
MRIATIVAGCTFFGIAMAIREYAGSMWLRALIAGVGGLGLGVAFVLAQRKCETKAK